MNIDQISAATDTLAWLSEQANSPGELRSERVDMGVVLALARLYLVEYAHHLGKGMEPYDALIATAKGELALTDMQRDVFRSLMPPVSAHDGQSPA